MLEAGLALLDQRDWASVSVADIAAVNGFSVGSFYTRFRDKDGYFEVLLRSVTDAFAERAHSFFASPAREREDAADLLASFVKLVLFAYRTHRGLFVATLKYASEHPQAWQAMSDLRTLTIDMLTQAMCVRLPEQRRMLRRRLPFAGQMINGTLINVVLNDPGPLRLHDRALERELRDAVLRYLELAPVHVAAATPAAPTAGID